MEEQASPVQPIESSETTDTTSVLDRLLHRDAQPAQAPAETPAPAAPVKVEDGTCPVPSCPDKKLDKNGVCPGCGYNAKLAVDYQS